MLFAGGQIQKMGSGVWGERTIALAQVALNSGDLKLRSVSLPDDIEGCREGIDDLAIINHELVALDNIIVPKFLLRFALDELPVLRYLGRETFAHGTYESAERLVSGDGWAAVLSTTVGMGGSGSIVSFWSLPYWRPFAGMSIHRGIFQADISGAEEWPRIAAIGSWLMIESTTRGLGLIHVPDVMEAWRGGEMSDQGRVSVDVGCIGMLRWRSDMRGHVMGLDQDTVVLCEAGELPIALNDADLRRISREA